MDVPYHVRRSALAAIKTVEMHTLPHKTRIIYAGYHDLSNAVQPGPENGNSPALYRLMNRIARGSQGNCAALQPRTEHVGPGPEQAHMGFTLVEGVSLESFERAVLAVARFLVDNYRSPTIFPQGNLLKFTKDTATPHKDEVEHKCEVELRLDSPLGILRAIVPTTRDKISQEWMTDITRNIRYCVPVALAEIKTVDICVYNSPRDNGSGPGWFSAKVVPGDSVDGMVSVEITGQSRYVSSASFLIEDGDGAWIEQLEDDASPATAL